MTQPRLPQLLALGLLVMVCALWVVQNKHEHRRLTTEFDRARAERSRLELEWSQLQLEEATLASHSRIEQVARERLGMWEPVDSVVVLSTPTPVSP